MDTENNPFAQSCNNGRERTLDEEIGASIERCNREVVRLIQLRDTAPRELLRMPISQVRRYAFPYNPF